MAKRIQAKTQNNRFIWMISPDIIVNPLKRKEGVIFLDIFHYFAQLLIKVDPKKKLSLEEKEKIIAAKKRILIELNNKVTQLKFFSKQLQKQEKKLLESSNKIKKKIYDYKIYQVFIGLLEAYLNTIHSIHNWLKEIDIILEKKFSKDIWKKEWFKLDTDLRNLFQHIESPLVIIQNGKIILICERINKLEYPKYFTKDVQERIKDQNGRYRISVNCQEMSNDMLDFLNNWSKRYLDLIDEKETVDIIVGFHKDGRTKEKKVSLKEFISKVNLNREQVW